jgi:hypothetical protein
MKTIFAILLGVTFLFAGQARAGQVQFTGSTTANQLLIKDTLQNILQFSYTRSKCETLSTVNANVLPKNYVPSDPKYRVGNPPVIYESWSATLCGEQLKFLVSFWPSPEGGTMFGIGFPYPPDAP